jgi:membrane protein involved in colicin uptake
VIIYFRHAKKTKSSRAKPLFENLEEKFSNYKERLKQLNLKRKHELTSKNSGT